MKTKPVNTGPLWVVTLLVSALVIGGTHVSHDHATAKMFGILAGITIPIICLLHSADGGRR